jgi:hypothetical protein
MHCKYLSKTLQNRFKCKLYKKQVSIFLDCKNCLETKYEANKGIKKVSKKKITVKKEIYDKVYERDKGCCRLCGTSKNLHLHHINGRGKDLTNNIDNCIMLCRSLSFRSSA